MPHWLYTGVVGLICGLIAKLLLPGYDGLGLIMTMIVGIVGAYVGTVLGVQFGKLRPGEPAGWIWSIIGSMVVLLAIRIF